MRKRAAFHAVAVAALSVALAGSACTARNQAKGGGSKVDFCAGYNAYDRLDEPDASQRVEVSRYADSVVRVMNRIDPDIRVDKQTLPKNVVDDVGTVKTAMRHLRDQATAPAAGVNAAGTFAFDPAYRDADGRLLTFYDDHCKPKASQLLNG